MTEEARDTPQKTQSVTIRLPNDIFSYIKQKSQREDRSINWIIAKMLQTKINEDQTPETNAL